MLAAALHPSLFNATYTQWTRESAYQTQRAERTTAEALVASVTSAALRPSRRVRCAGHKPRFIFRRLHENVRKELAFASAGCQPGL